MAGQAGTTDDAWVACCVDARPIAPDEGPARRPGGRLDPCAACRSPHCGSFCALVGMYQESL